MADHSDVAKNIAEAVNSGQSIQQMTADLMQNPELLSALNEQLASVIGTSSGYIEELPKEIARRIGALKNLQKEHMALEMELQKEIAEIERKYLAKFQPLYNKREQIVNGKYEPTEEESKYDEDEGEDEDKEKEEGDKKEGEDKEEDDEEEEPLVGIPGFWMTALQNHEFIQEMIEEHDLEILEHLTDIKLEYLEGANTGFVLHFVFEENEYFTNEVLTKTYYLQPDPEDGDLIYEGPVLEKSEGTKINWKEGKNVTVKLMKKKQRKKGGSSPGKTRTVVKATPQKSFFHFFSPPAMPEDGESSTDELEGVLSTDFEVGDIIRERIIPVAVLWFTGEAIDDDDEEEEEEMDEDDLSDDENDPDYAPPTGEEKPECNQS